MRTLIGLAAALASAGAGIYLLTNESAAQYTTVTDVLMHGLGAYFIAQGLWMVHEMMRADEKAAPLEERAPAEPTTSQKNWWR